MTDFIAHYKLYTTLFLGFFYAFSISFIIMYLTVSISSTILLTLTAVATSAIDDKQVQQQPSGSSQTSPYLAVSSPAWLADIKTPFDDARSLILSEDDIMVRPLEEVKNLQLTNYPPPMRAPPVNDPEVQAVIKQLDWSQVPDAPIRKATPDGELNVEAYDSQKDPHCWWSSTLCKTPKVNYIPEDISYCPNAGDWGLNYDDGPYRVWSDDENEKRYEEPRLYNFLIEQGKLKSTLFCKFLKNNDNNNNNDMEMICLFLRLLNTAIIMSRYRL